MQQQWRNTCLLSQYACNDTLYVWAEGLLICRDFGGNMRFSGQATTVKCFENNPLVRKVGL